MLKNINPLLTGELLHLLDELGHGDQLGLVDRNFPAYRYDMPVIDLRGADTRAAAEALLSVFPLDAFVDTPIERMEIDGSPDEVTAATTALAEIAAAQDPEAAGVESVERFDFYQRATAARGFIQTGETIPYSCYLLKKGVV
ncbi:RbsD/FucU family protein [Propionibacteriaceae bacterium Y1700]|uniref:RbsD/FucU family protein n=1 Tax=Microlunatus sp. Y1700 TaxID=3418487 RepID=UPI003DA6E72D